MLKIYAAGAAYSPCEDRFVVKGYREGIPFTEMIDEFAKIEGLNGLGMLPPETDAELAVIKEKMAKHNFKMGVIATDTYLQAEQKVGTFSSRDAGLRKKSIQHIKDCMDLAVETDAFDVLMWFAHDGFDYPFEDDYTLKWDWLMDGLAEVAEYNPDVRLTVEYKKAEPRTHQYFNTVGTTIAMLEKIGKPNLGVTVDMGHSLQAGENVAWAVEFAHRFGRLMDIHVNDNYRGWDDDLLIGSVHFMETLEFFYSLRRIGYDGWFDIDIWPSRVNGPQALQESVKRIQMFSDLANRLYESAEFTKLREQGETMLVQQYVRELIWTGR